MTNLTQLYDAVLNGKREEGIAITENALKEGVNPQIIINDYMVKAMEEIEADGYSSNANGAVALARQLIEA